MPYFVIGGEYSDTTFRSLVKRAPVIGPLASWEEAYERWRERSFASMDNALVRFSIVEQRGDAEPPRDVEPAPQTTGQR